MAENMLLGLCLVGGISFSDFRRLHGRDLLARYSAEPADLWDAGLLMLDDERVYVTGKGRLLANQVFLRFSPADTKASG